MGPRSVACVIWGTHVLAGEQEAWDCSNPATDDLWGGNAAQVLVVCLAAGEYDGLTYVFHRVAGGAQDLGDGADIHGLIYAGPLPAWGCAVEPPAEQTITPQRLPSALAASTLRCWTPGGRSS